jgi:hypothetical protein
MSSRLADGIATRQPAILRVRVPGHCSLTNGSIVPAADNDRYVWRIHGMMSVEIRYTLRKPLIQLHIPCRLAKD